MHLRCSSEKKNIIIIIIIIPTKHQSETTLEKSARPTALTCPSPTPRCSGRWAPPTAATWSPWSWSWPSSSGRGRTSTSRRRWGSRWSRRARERGRNAARNELCCVFMLSRWNILWNGYSWMKRSRWRYQAGRWVIFRLRSGVTPSEWKGRRIIFYLASSSGVARYYEDYK